jgi:Flp pilus assembly protein TadG
MRRLLATALLGFAVTATATASAEAPSTLTTSDGVLFQTCVQHPVSYAASPGSGNWSLFLSSTRSDGSSGPFVSLSSTAHRGVSR